MPDRDVEKVRSKGKFVATLRRVADALERGEPVRIQVAGKRVVVPMAAQLSVEHEVEGGDEELELQFKWKNASAAAPKAKRAKKTATRVKKTATRAKKRATKTAKRAPVKRAR